MATFTNFTLNGIPFDTVREPDWKLEVQFGLNNSPSIAISNVSFVNTEKSNTSDKVRLAHDTLPTEGGRLGFQVTDGLLSYDFQFILDYNSYKKLAPNETSCDIYLDKSIDSLLDLQGEDITMELLKYKGLLGEPNYVNHPYTISNRKTILEKLAIATNGFILIKSAIDEIFKIINIASDITSGGIVQALINLGQTVISLVVLIERIKNLVIETVNSFNPQIRYHSAIELKEFLRKAAEYLGYEIEFGVWDENFILIPSKNDEIGYTEPITTFFQPGILKPTDYGYNLKESFDLAKRLVNARLAVIDNTIHCRPVIDPFWETIGSYVMPNILVEQSIFIDNGYSEFNRNELKSSTIFKYETDDSDYYTIQQAASDTNGDRFSIEINTPISTINERLVNIRGIDINTIPYSLVVRKNVLDDIIEALSNLSGEFSTFIDMVKSKWGDVEGIISETFPMVDELGFEFDRDGALKCENHFFSRPKISILETTESGRIRIPENFNDIIGAKALKLKYFSYDSLIEGVRDPLNPLNTAGKEVFKGVRIPFNIENANQVLNNSYFSTSDGKRGKFTRLVWDVKGDSADVDFWIQTPWLKNVQREIS